MKVSEYISEVLSKCPEATTITFEIFLTPDAEVTYVPRNKVTFTVVKK